MHDACDSLLERCPDPDRFAAYSRNTVYSHMKSSDSQDCFPILTSSLPIAHAVTKTAAIPKKMVTGFRNAAVKG